jgi:hypothetical protein
LQSVAKRKPSPARENRVIVGIAHDRWPRSLNATMNKNAHIEIIAETWCFGKTPMQTFLDAMPMTKEKMIAA